MPTVIMPKMGDAMEEGTLLRWLKEVGDEVNVGDPLAEIETDKVSLEIEAADAGVLTKTYVEEGATVPIGAPIAAIGEEDAEVAAEAPSPAPEPAAAPAAPATAMPSAVPAPAISPTNGRGAARPASAPVPVPAAAATTASGERLRASPLVKRLAAEHGIDLSTIAGTGPGGRIVRDDIAALLTGAPSAAPAPAAPSPAPAAPTPAPAPAAAPAAVVSAPSGRPPGVAREFSTIRRTTGRRMAESKAAAPHFYVTVEVDMAQAAALREQINAQAPDEAKVSFNDLIVKATALALRDFPNLNASIENDQLVEHPNIDINVAVAIEDGLIAPFIPDADEKGLGTIARMTKDLIGRARKGGLTPNEYQGGTFTISNLGMFDVEEFIAIINPPQAAILAVGSIKDVPVVANGEIVPGKRMNITLSADHRITDGAEVARFLQVIKRYLENPLTIAFG
ncbi:MAG: 2-oxo acid dehydrogenase subunit E2 [Thermomicrobiales bacterium]|nr:2-oxo acid dehydrogenase subunit E2 [Thermomicrobiales bacterium]